MSKLNLIPNEVVGYRIHPDQWNWTVVVVKKHGESSKNAGQEYENPLSYCKDLRNAVKYIVNHVAAIDGDKTQQHVFNTTGVSSSLEALKVAFEKAEQAAVAAVDDLEARLKASGFDLSALTKKSLINKEEEVASEDIAA